MLDDELSVVSRSRPTLGHEIPLLENPEVRLRAVEEVCHGSAPEHAADDGAGLKRGLLQRGEAVDPCREHRVHSVRHRGARVGAADRPAVSGLDKRAAVDQLTHEFFEKERVPVGALDEAVAQIVRQSRELLLEELRHGRGGQRIEPEDCRVALPEPPGRPELDDLRTSGRNEHDGTSNVGG